MRIVRNCRVRKYAESGVAWFAYPGRDAYRKILEERYKRTIARFNE